MIKIILFIYNINGIGGTERAVVNLINMLQQEGKGKYDISLVSLFSEKNNLYYPIHSPIEIIHLKRTFSSNFLVRNFTLLRLFPTLRKIINQKNPDFLIGTSFDVNIILQLLSANKNKVVGCEHMPYNFASTFGKFMKRLIYPKLYNIVLLTQEDRNHYRYLNSNVKIIPNTLSFFQEKGADLTNKQLLAVGRYTFQKGFDILIELCPALFKDREDWTLKIIGDGEMKESLQQRIKKLNLEKNVLLLPPTPGIQVEYQHASIYVMTSRFEGLPMVLIEAKALGLPIVSYNCPEGPKELIENGKDGYLVDLENSSTFVTKTQELMDDFNKRSEFGKKARENVWKKYAPEVVYKMWENIFCH